jgi:hypothetical protein
LAIATVGAGIQGSTTSALGADIIAFSQTRGLFGGISLEGSLMGQRSGWNRAYYGKEMGSRQIVIDMQGSNPGADPLRDVLTRYGSEQRQAAAASPPTGTPPAVSTPGAPVQLSPPPGAVKQQNLPPPR